MGVGFSIKFSNVYEYLEELNSILGSVERLKDNVENIQKELQMQGTLKRYGVAVGKVVDQLNTELSNIRNRENVLQKVVRDYENLEKRLAEGSLKKIGVKKIRPILRVGKIQQPG